MGRPSGRESTVVVSRSETGWLWCVVVVGESCAVWVPVWCGLAGEEGAESVRGRVGWPRGFKQGVETVPVGLVAPHPGMDRG